MTETGEGLSPEQILAAIHAEQNKIAEEDRDNTLPGFLFHEHLMARDEFKEYSLHLHEAFMIDKKATVNMGERMALVLREPYIGIINLVELGLTTTPGTNGEVDGLKHQYHELLQWMNNNRWNVAELSREECGRMYSIRKTAITPDRLVVSRYRPLISAQQNITLAENHRLPMQIDVVKRMVFSMPTMHLQVLATRYGATRNPDGKVSMDEISRILNETDMATHLDDLLGSYEAIDPIRTGYFLTTKMV